MQPLPDLFGADALAPADLNGPDRPDDLLRQKRRGHDGHVSSIWSFPGSGGRQLYRWYGTLPRPLVERVFEVFDPGDGTFVDGFSGTGVSLDVANDFGMTALGYDTNPLACLIAEARLRGLPPTRSVMEDVARVSAKAKQPGPPSESWTIGVQSDDFSYSRKWFRDDTLVAVLKLLEAVSEVKDARTQRYFFVALAQVVRDVASVDARCTHHYVRKEKPFVDPVPLWAKRVRDNVGVVRPAPLASESARVVQASFQSAEPSESADLLLLHPPYLGVIHYNLIHRLATDLLGIAQEVRRPVSLSGLDFSHANIKAEDMSTDNGKKYSLTLKDVASAADRMLKEDGTCIVIIGDQRHKGFLRHPFTDIVVEFESLGMMMKEMFIWVLQNNGGMHIKRKGHFIDHNYIMAFSRQRS